ncbi:methyltransferase family protein [Cellulomonas endophytica]|uniref:methyltransferase family protein n=1 Tax=Cellulomonas endophytica TaxID=2494735 RepID=UPI001011101B|nr:isoprenylcysteine carboxylmethyltransferase family protein [Cellulomonas endophytica]
MTTEDAGLVALVLYAIGCAATFGWRSYVHRRRTGSAGFRGISGPVGSAGWWGGVLFVVALVAGALGPALAAAGVLPARESTAVARVVVGALLALVGFVLVLAAQGALGSSWRIGVDPAERTALVTDGWFSRVRNPVFSAMVVALAGIALVIPTVLTVAALVALVLAVQLQVRCVEEPYLRAVHGASYLGYAGTVGRFVPGMGRYPRAGTDPATTSSTRGDVP